MAAIRGQPVLGHPRPSPPACFGSNERGFERLLLPKQAGGLGPGCPKTGCPLIAAMGSFQKLHGWNQHEKPVKMIYNMSYSEQNQLICRSRWGWAAQKNYWNKIKIVSKRQGHCKHQSVHGALVDTLKLSFGKLSMKLSYKLVLTYVMPRGIWIVKG